MTRTQALSLLLALSAAACREGGSSGQAALSARVTERAAPQVSAGGAPAVVTEQPAVEPIATETSDLSPPEPSLTDGGVVLPQTKERPRLDTARWRALGPLLFRAIVRDEPALARTLFFPKLAYAQVKAIADPVRDWRSRLMRAFERDIHRYHGELGPDAAKCRFSRLEVAESRVRWVEPGREANRLGYYRVLRSRLVYIDPAGAEREFGITSLISWRGEWYIVHLFGFG